MNSSLETTPNSTATIEFFGRRLDISRLFAGTLLASPLRRRFTSNVAFIVAGNGASQAASLLAYFAVARVLGKDAFGRFSLVQNTAVVLAGLTGCLGLTATKHLAAFRASDSRRAGAALGLLDTAAFAAALTMAVVLFFGATPVSAVAFHAASLAPLLRIAALLLFFTAITNSQSGALAGFEAYKRMTGPLFFRAAMILPVFVAGDIPPGKEAGAVVEDGSGQRLAALFRAVKTEIPYHQLVAGIHAGPAHAEHYGQLHGFVRVVILCLNQDLVVPRGG